MATPDTLTDFSAQIREEIGVEVLKLKRDVEGRKGSADYYPRGPIHAECVFIGYAINTHHGHDLFARGDFLHGLEVKVDAHCPRALTVSAGDVEFIEVLVPEGYNEDGDFFPAETKLRHQEVTASTTL